MLRKQKLVVIGNGMAGARLVEDILARGGADNQVFYPAPTTHRIFSSTRYPGTKRTTSSCTQAFASAALIVPGKRCTAQTVSAKAMTN